MRETCSYFIRTGLAPVQVQNTRLRRGDKIIHISYSNCSGKLSHPVLLRARLDNQRTFKRGPNAHRTVKSLTRRDTKQRWQAPQLMNEWTWLTGIALHLRETALALADTVSTS